MDPEIEALVEVLQQINQLSGAALDVLLQASGGGDQGGTGAPPAPAPEGAPPAPPEG